MAGIETNRFVDFPQSLAKHLECGICLNVYFNPMDTLCRHTFCCHCIKTCIQTNGKVCPYCKQSLVSRKRSESSANVVVIGNDVILEKNRKIDDIINDLKIKCDYDYKGCEEVLAFGLLSSHLKCCLFRLCSDCGLIEDKANPHNCLQALKQTINELNEKMKEMTKDLKTKDKTISDLNKQLIECQKQLNVISVYNQMNGSVGQILSVSGESYYVMFGTYRTSAKDITFHTEGIKISTVSPNAVEKKFKYNIAVPFIEIQELKYCLDSQLNALFIKPIIYSCLKIQECLHLGYLSFNGFVFNIQSNDIKQQFIKIVFKTGFENKFKDLMKALRIANHCPIESIDANSAQQLLT